MKQPADATRISFLTDSVEGDAQANGLQSKRGVHNLLSASHARNMMWKTDQMAAQWLMVEKIRQTAQSGRILSPTMKFVFIVGGNDE